MNTNNAILFVFLLIFVASSAVNSIVQAEFGNTVIDNRQDEIFDNFQQGDPTAQGTLASANDLSTLIFNFFLGIFFWEFGAPIWLNILFTIMRIIFGVIIYDKIRGVGS